MSAMRSFRGNTKVSRQVPPAGAISGMIGSMIGRMHHVVLDCPDPVALAAFYSTLQIGRAHV